MLFLTERAAWNDATIVAAVAVKVGAKKSGLTIKPGVFYTLRGGRVVQA